MMEEERIFEGHEKESISLSDLVTDTWCRFVSVSLPSGCTVSTERAHRDQTIEYFVNCETERTQCDMCELSAMRCVRSVFSIFF